ncbi:unnamed protein product [Soboliphyme baturini]|uniref:DUF2655 domain-containing protein n=1 Tax=Soboliphyme baturini TaxID=241478 RepID=A0A183J746_9BILA|nr:unnamed protein product [Soboliphyme baturini]
MIAYGIHLLCAYLRFVDSRAKKRYLCFPIGLEVVRRWLAVRRVEQLHPAVCLRVVSLNVRADLKAFRC